MGLFATIPREYVSFHWAHTSQCCTSTRAVQHDSVGHQCWPALRPIGLGELRGFALQATNDSVGKGKGQLYTGAQDPAKHGVLPSSRNATGPNSRFEACRDHRWSSTASVCLTKLSRPNQSSAPVGLRGCEWLLNSGFECLRNSVSVVVLEIESPQIMSPLNVETIPHLQLATSQLLSLSQPDLAINILIWADFCDRITNWSVLSADYNHINFSKFEGNRLSHQSINITAQRKFQMNKPENPSLSEGLFFCQKLISNNHGSIFKVFYVYVVTMCCKYAKGSWNSMWSNTK